MTVTDDCCDIDTLSVCNHMCRQKNNFTSHAMMKGIKSRVVKNRSDAQDGNARCWSKGIDLDRAEPKHDPVADLSQQHHDRRGILEVPVRPILLLQSVASVPSVSVWVGLVRVRFGLG